MAKGTFKGAVDFAYLEAYAADDRALIDDVLVLFRGQAKLGLERLGSAPDNAAWRDAAHSLKGSALGIGAGQLAQACAEAESGCDKPAPAKSAMLQRLHDALEDVLADIDAYDWSRRQS